MGLSAVFACVGLISGVIATLPMRTVRKNPDGTTERLSSWLDEPCGLDGPTYFEFIEGVMTSLLLHGNYFARKVRSVGAGHILWLLPYPPQCVHIEIKDGRKLYKVSLENGKTEVLTDYDILHIPGKSLDLGVTGVGLVSIARNMVGTSIAGERAAAQLFRDGALMSGFVTPKQSLKAEEFQIVRDAIDTMVAGIEKAGSIVALSSEFDFKQWSVNPEDAQFLESRQWQVNEVARWFGVPPHLVGDVERSTSWGEGISEQTRNFQRLTLQSWTSRIEARLTRVLREDPGAANQKIEFDYRQLLNGTPAEETDLVIKQVEAGILTPNEARAFQNRAPIEGGDVLRTKAPQPQKQEPDGPN